ncbi:MAG: RES domain-containing protein [Actinomycetota bacterium]|nr:RES domain-containing protein [Actinomycetota bacterium]
MSGLPPRRTQPRRTHTPHLRSALPVRSAPARRRSATPRPGWPLGAVSRLCLATSLCEVFGEAEHAALCPRWRVAALEPSTRLRLFDLCEPGSAMAIGALPALADAALPRSLTQGWARAIYEDQPARDEVAGIRYRSACNGGISLVLWNSANDVTTVHGTGGELTDVALSDPAMLTLVRAACTLRRITVKPSRLSIAANVSRTHDITRPPSPVALIRA